MEQEGSKLFLSTKDQVPHFTQIPSLSQVTLVNKDREIMAKAIQNFKEGEVINLRKTREGKIQKKTPTEMKNYRITELSALEGKVKKINTSLSLEEEKNNGKSIMINMKTSTFEVVKQNLMEILEKHQLIKNVKLVRTAKASTENAGEADMEYHVDLDLVVDSNVHNLKLKCYNTNCRIQVQHMGKSSHSVQDYLKMKSPVKYFAEEILYPIVASMNDDIDIEKEKEMVLHLKKELTRLKKVNKTTPKQNKKEKCVNSDCKHQNNLDISKIDKYGKCRNCEGYEHFNCANIQENQRKRICLNGSKEYLCTECLIKYPILALESVDIVPADNIVATVQEASGEENTEEHNGISSVSIGEESQKRIQCQKCKLIVNTTNQLETHNRLQHTEVVNYDCEKCEFKSSTKSQLEEHQKNIHTVEQIEVHESRELVCSKCKETLETQEKLEEHIAKHSAPVFVCGECETQCQNEDDLKVHNQTKHTQSTCQDKCKNYEELEKNYNQLKENYERLIQIIKKLETTNKDKDLAMETQMEELRIGYDITKKENIKLQDNLETQNKLWKMWLSKFEESPANITDRTSNNLKESSSHDMNEEVLLIEDSDDQNDEEKENEDEDIDKVFVNYFKNLKETGFRRTTPADKPEKVQRKRLSCTMCMFTSNSNTELVEHIRIHTEDVSCQYCKSTAKNNTELMAHIRAKHPINLSSKTVRFDTKNNESSPGLNNQYRTKHTAKNENDVSERRPENKPNTQYCHFWNNYGSCHFELKNNRPCRFEHKNAPRCKNDGQCDRNRCMFRHINQNMSFLATTKERVQPQFPQRGGMRSQKLWNVQFPHQNTQGGIRVWENTRNF